MWNKEERKTKMSEYVKKLKEEPSFKQNGLNGYIYELQTKDMGLVLED